MIRGGARTRLIADSLRLALFAGLSELGWFDATIWDHPAGSRRHKPVRYITRPSNWDVEITPNCFAVSTEGVDDDERGFAGEVEDVLTVYIDVFGESEAVAWGLTGDMRDILLGRSPVSHPGPVLEVFDLRSATPAAFTTVDIDGLIIDHAQGPARAWQQHWIMLRVSLSDEYLDEYDWAVDSDWDSVIAAAWVSVQQIASGP